MQHYRYNLLDNIFQLSEPNFLLFVDWLLTLLEFLGKHCDLIFDLLLATRRKGCTWNMSGP